MNVQRTATTNKTFKLPGGTEENDLPVTVGEEDGHPTISSFWLPTDEERAKLAAGAYVELTVWGQGTPPVALRVSSYGGLDGE
jgi:hypothetical protein